MSDFPSPCCAPSSERDAKSSVSPFVITPAKGAVGGPMVSLPGGTFLMGTDYPRGFIQDGEGPVRQVTLSPFEIDAFPVTNEDFAKFISATAYQTDAERFGWSFVFWGHIPEERFEDLVEDTIAQAPWWCKVAGAAWFAPEGPGSDVATRGRHPVVHVSWNDAHAYAQWASKSLPTEAQWEYAARGGLEQKLYPWGDELTPDQRPMCNIWQGQFPLEDTGEDGFIGSCPVDAFPPNGFGVYSVSGNTWDWCGDWFQVIHKEESTDPVGPCHGESKVLKGGSFLCHDSYCNRYRVGARTQSPPDSSSSNVGFRCARMFPSS